MMARAGVAYHSIFSQSDAFQHAVPHEVCYFAFKYLWALVDICEWTQAWAQLDTGVCLPPSTQVPTSEGSDNSALVCDPELTPAQNGTVRIPHEGTSL